MTPLTPDDFNRWNRNRLAQVIQGRPYAPGLEHEAFQMRHGHTHVPEMNREALSAWRDFWKDRGQLAQTKASLDLAEATKRWAQAASQGAAEYLRLSREAIALESRADNQYADILEAIRFVAYLDSRLAAMPALQHQAAE